MNQGQLSRNPCLSPAPILLLSKYKSSRISSLTIFKPNTTRTKKIFHSNSTINGSLKTILVYPLKTVRPQTAASNGPGQPNLPDEDVPTNIFVNQNIRHHRPDLKLPILQDLPEVASWNFAEIFSKKVSLCLEMCDFSSPYVDSDAKDIKSSTLNEILKLLETSKSIKALQPSMIESLISMIQANITRVLPQVSRSIYLVEDVPLISDPAWPHLSLVYQILNRIIRTIPSDPHFTMAFFDSLRPQLRTADLNEQEALIAFFIEFFHYHAGFSSEVITKITDMISEHRETGSHPFVVGALLALLKAIFLDLTPDSSIIDQVFKRDVIPLIGDNFFQFFATRLFDLITTFVDERETWPPIILDGCLQYWPQTRISKQEWLIKLVTRVIPNVGVKEMAKIAPRVFSIYSISAASTCQRIADTALTYFQTNQLMPTISQIRKETFSAVIPAFYLSSQRHWAHSVRENAKMALQELIKIDSKLTAELIQKTKTFEDNRYAVWVKIARIASTIDPAIQLSDSITKIAFAYQPATRKRGGIQHSSSNRFRPQNLRTEADSLLNSP